MSARHVYVHVPFCARKCPYCDFNSHAGRDDEQDAYVEALLEEARVRAAGTRPSTLFIGGGTPTHLGVSTLETLLQGLVSILGVDHFEEATIEANPGSLDRAKLRVLRDAGFDRVSLGVQSFDDRHLTTLSRIHDARAAVRSAVWVREAGFPRLSIDLILAIPHQSLADQARDLARAVDLEPDHVSAYVLTFEEGTVFTRMLSEGRLPRPKAERELAHLHLAIERLGDAGFLRYEVSNFAREGEACRHNLAYWEDRSWIGLGAGAHSHSPGCRRKNVSDPMTYIRRMREEGDATDWVERSTPEVQAFEALMMGLRLEAGIDLDRLARRCRSDPRETHAATLARHVEAGLLVHEGARLSVTPRGFDLLSAILRDYLP